MTAKLKKFPHVSLYAVKNRYRLTTCEIDGRRLTRRLGANAANAERYAAKVSDWIDQWKSDLMPTSKLLHQLGESMPVAGLIERYRAYLQGKDRSKVYISVTCSRIEALLAAADATKIGQINARGLTRGLAKLRAEGTDGRPLSDQTIAHYVRAIRQFVKFCYRKEKVIDEDPITDLDSAAVGTIVRDRREPSALEISLLLTHTARLAIGPYTMTGMDRSMLYAFAISTGLRAGELREVRAEWIDLERGMLTVPKEFTKNKKVATQPLPAWLIARAKDWLVVKGNKRVWPAMSKMTANTLRADQRAAREAWIESATTAEEREERLKSDVLKYKTEAGYFDFHSLRHAFVSRIVGAGTATVKDAQTLARHSTAELTIARYSHAEAESLRKHVDGAIVDPFSTA